MTILLVLAMVVFLVATIGLAIQRSYWVALIGLGLALAMLAELWPHIGVH